jgi:hypothetical protein
MNAVSPSHEEMIDDFTRPANSRTTAQARKHIRKVLRTGALSLHASGRSVGLGAVTAAHVEDNVVVSIPLRDLGERSNVTVLFDRNWNMTSFTEAHLREIDASSGHATIWSDGNLIVDRVVNADEIAPHSGETGTMRHKSSYWSALNSCLSSAGIASWLVAAALVACGATGPVGAVICLIGAGIGVGTASFCARWAWAHR